MRIFIFIRKLLIGGSIINAINLAGAMKRRGHDVLFVAEDGDMRFLVEQHGLNYISYPWYDKKHPSMKAARELADLIKDFQPDIVHNWEDSIHGIEEVIWASRVLTKTPLLITYMGNHIFKEFHFPQCVPITIAVPSLAEEAFTIHGWNPDLLTIWNSRMDLDRARVDPSLALAFRSRYGLLHKCVILTTVRLEPQWKWPYVRLLLSAFESLCRDHPNAVLVICGDGPAMPDAKVFAERINTRAGRDAVVLTGWVRENHEAYAAADIVVGQGSTLLWALAHGKPAITVGTFGYSAILEPGKIDLLEFMHFYSDKAVSEPEQQLAGLLRELLVHREYREKLGRFGKLYVQKFSLEVGAEQMEKIYERAIRNQPAQTLVMKEMALAHLSLVRFRGKRKLLKMFGNKESSLSPKTINYLIFPQ